MINYRPSGASGATFEHRELTGEANHLRESLTALEISLSRLHQAKRIADESLRRAQDAPGPHTSENAIFVALWESHLGDREMLFSAMRQLDHARQALDSAGIGEPDKAD
ncbi:hypothetical protein [Mesorhizobium retamae]|uniref:Uncharacterized protein n=1 Tax=Mesorhizobium retamae TaxID=2912854 RepID=A0ABS9QNS0_9HYPH|nr:hypothetical protein [Mesorhizobium sp. IRAMC:0171]MCG7509057.1 hypothetical protein [Mesorhizobium sp. IRAMC:0171]